MNLNEEYGFDAFCAQLVTQWPEVGLTLRRRDNKVFATASALGQTAIALSRDNELAGSTVRRAVVELHARLVAATAVPAVTAGVTTRDANAVRYEQVETRLEEIDSEMGDIQEALESIAQTIADFAAGEVGLDTENIQELSTRLATLHGNVAVLDAEREKLEEEAAKLEELLA